MHEGCACHQPIGYVSYGRTYPENAGRVSTYHYQYRTYFALTTVRLSCQGFTIPCCTRVWGTTRIPCYTGATCRSGISAYFDQHGTARVCPGTTPWNRRMCQLPQLNVKPRRRLPRPQLQQEPSVPCTHSPNPRDGRRRVGQTDSKGPKGSGGEPLLSPPVHSKRQAGKQDLEDQKPVVHLDLGAAGPPGLRSHLSTRYVGPITSCEERK